MQPTKALDDSSAIYSARQIVEKGPLQRFTLIGSAYHIPIAITLGGDINCPRIVLLCYHNKGIALPTNLLPVYVRVMYANNLNNALYN
jgi:hypothetical protein